MLIELPNVVVHYEVPSEPTLGGVEMSETLGVIDEAPLQDRDLLQRLSLYFDGFEHQLRRGQGWFIFNARGGRSERISRFISIRLAEFQPSVNAYLVPWRDFALSAYVNEVGLADLAPIEGANFSTARAKEEYELAKVVTERTRARLILSDLVVVTGLRPAHWHEAQFLDRTIDERYQQRLATILLTPEQPTELQADYASVDPTQTFWTRLFERMYETSLVAL